jgi:hypothetical protein
MRRRAARVARRAAARRTGCAALSAPRGAALAADVTRRAATTCAGEHSARRSTPPPPDPDPTLSPAQAGDARRRGHAAHRIESLAPAQAGAWRAAWACVLRPTLARQPRHAAAALPSAPWCRAARGGERESGLRPHAHTTRHASACALHRRASCERARTAAACAMPTPGQDPRARRADARAPTHARATPTLAHGTRAQAACAGRRRWDAGRWRCLRAQAQFALAPSVAGWRRCRPRRPSTASTPPRELGRRTQVPPSPCRHDRRRPAPTAQRPARPHPRPRG